MVMGNLARGKVHVSTMLDFQLVLRLISNFSLNRAATPD